MRIRFTNLPPHVQNIGRNDEIRDVQQSVAELYIERGWAVAVDVPATAVPDEVQAEALAAPAADKQVKAAKKK